ATDNYYVLVSDFDLHQTGSYLQIGRASFRQKASDSNGDSGELTSGATHAGSISPLGDIDRFEINLIAGEPFILVATDPGNTTGFDPTINLYRSSGAPVASASDQPVAVISGIAPATDNYYVLVSDFDLHQIGSYF